KARALCPDVPFLFVSGTIGEERAVEGLKQGATDFVIKDRVARLVPAARRANDGLWDWDMAEDKVFFSPRWKEMLGFGEAEIGDRLEEWLSRVHAEDLPGLYARLHAHLDGDSEDFECEYRIAHRS